MSEERSARALGPAPNQHPAMRLGVRVVAVLVAVAGVWFVRELLDAVPPAPPEVGAAATLLPVAKPLPDFALVDEAGQPFTRDALAGRWSFLFFGYTNCPSICPLTLADMRDLRRELRGGDPAVDAQWVFVSVDPERDSPERIARYVHQFDPDFRGAMGSPEELRRLTSAVGVFHERTPGGSDEAYDFDHTASLLLVDPDAELHAVFSPPIDPPAAAEAYRAIRRLAGPSDATAAP